MLARKAKYFLNLNNYLNEFYYPYFLDGKTLLRGEATGLAQGLTTGQWQNGYANLSLSLGQGYSHNATAAFHTRPLLSPKQHDELNEKKLQWLRAWALRVR